MKKTYLVLENERIFNGYSFGCSKEVVGEIVFTTAMTGYLETLTDPSYYGQIVLMTFPLVGNYGVIASDFESNKVWPKGFIVKYPCSNPSNFRSEGDIDSFLKEKGVSGIHGIDTRALTKIIRNEGAMNGKIMFSEPTKKDFDEIKAYKVINAVKSVSNIDNGNYKQELKEGMKKIALIDTGSKRSIENELIKRGCFVKRFSCDITSKEILEFKPDGIMLSNGPGDPAEKINEPLIQTVKELIKSKVPIFGICLGHQLLALAHGHKTRKLKFGHRSANQPVKELSTGKVFITTQNHGYEVVADKPSMINVNDLSCEGMDYGLSFSVQFHPEASGGPLDTTFLFDRFMERIERGQK
ncbi:MAG: glutamine-hydrolyzing carbamoyl-phosphate synthase small subunit [Firmicutes bacterium]|nr:glutamine-hydrolyzing carbamoyl-phosphate synthase small subunit [Bacillota bacterium]MCL2255544.1 glutamine-hydrolyzing carbamoyl-phosphate synthase small subunit [Bacillota bacterium]